MNDLLDRLNQGRNAGVQHEGCNDHGGEVFNASVAQRVLLVRLLSGQLGAHNGNDGGKGVTEIVDGVQDHGNGGGQDADDCLESGEEYIGQDPDDTGPDNHLFTIGVHGKRLLFLWIGPGFRQKA